MGAIASIIDPRIEQPAELEEDYRLPRTLLLLSHCNVGEWVEAERLVRELE